jgi:hypothetical protein
LIPPGIFVRGAGFFFHPGELFLEPVGFLGDGLFLPQGNLGGVTKLGSTGSQLSGSSEDIFSLSVEDD